MERGKLGYLVVWNRPRPYESINVLELGQGQNHCKNGRLISSYIYLSIKYRINKRFRYTRLIHDIFTRYASYITLGLVISRNSYFLLSIILGIMIGVAVSSFKFKCSNNASSELSLTFTLITTYRSHDLFTKRLKTQNIQAAIANCHLSIYKLSTKIWKYISLRLYAVTSGICSFLFSLFSNIWSQWNVDWVINF